MLTTELKLENIDETIGALRAALKHTWVNFCTTTSIHGLKYTKDKETNKWIRLIWYLISSVSFVCAAVMVYTFYVEYRSNPTRMNVEDDYAPVSMTQFPPTTICPDVLFNTEKSTNYLQTLILPKSVSVGNISDLLGITYGFMYDDLRFQFKDLELLDELLKLNQLTIVTFMRSLRWKCEDLLFRCRFNRIIVPCQSLFQTVRTFNGYCCGFNLNQSGLSHFSNQKAYSGLNNGLSLILYYNDSMYNRIRSYSLGFKVMIQETNAFPSAHSANKFVALNEEVFLSVIPTETLSSEEVKELPFAERQCTYPYEKKITYFRNYVAANCELNCRATNMVKHCGCYTYFFYNNSTNERICTYRDIPCLIDHFDLIIGRLRKYQCKCFNSCEKIEYFIDATSGPLNLEVPTMDKFYKGLKHNYAALHVYVKSGSIVDYSMIYC